MKKNTMLLIISLEAAVIAALIVAIVLICSNGSFGSSSDSESEDQYAELLDMFDGDPLYVADGTLVVDVQRTQSANDTQSQMTSSREIVNLCNEFVNSRSFLTQISEDMDGRYSIEQLKKMISCSSRNGTQVIEVKVVGDDPHDVYEICESVLKRASEQLPDYMGGKALILDSASLSKVPIKD